MRILTVDNKKDENFLKSNVPEINLDTEDKKDLKELIKKMILTMKEANGVGLSANQVGLSKRLFVAQVPDKDGRQKFYAVLNPKVVKESEDKAVLEEGCLSIPYVFGFVERPKAITLEGFSAQGKKLKIKAWGLLARVFQHEIDHLDGVLFTQKAKDIKRVTSNQ